MDRAHQALMKAELDAIDAWDENHHRNKTHSATDEFAYRVRQDRRQEIMTELAACGASAIRIRARIHACRKCRKINAPLGAGC